MNDEVRDLRDAGYKPIAVGPQPLSFDDLLRNVDPVPDEETDVASHIFNWHSQAPRRFGYSGYPYFDAVVSPAVAAR